MLLGNLLMDPHLANRIESITSFHSINSPSQNSQYIDFIGKFHMHFFYFTSTPQNLIHQRFAGRYPFKTTIFTPIFKRVEVKFLSPNLVS
jgi:hypothetical protein